MDYCPPDGDYKSPPPHTHVRRPIYTVTPPLPQSNTPLPWRYPATRKAARGEYCHGRIATRALGHCATLLLPAATLRCMWERGVGPNQRRGTRAKAWRFLVLGGRGPRPGGAEGRSSQGRGRHRQRGPTAGRASRRNAASLRGAMRATRRGTRRPFPRAEPGPRPGRPRTARPVQRKARTAPRFFSASKVGECVTRRTRRTPTR